MSDVERGRKWAEAQEPAQKLKDDRTRLDETERRMVTGDIHPVQRRILELMKQHEDATTHITLPKKS